MERIDPLSPEIFARAEASLDFGPNSESTSPDKFENLTDPESLTPEDLYLLLEDAGLSVKDLERLSEENSTDSNENIMDASVYCDVIILERYFENRFFGTEKKQFNDDKYLLMMEKFSRLSKEQKLKLIRKFSRKYIFGRKDLSKEVSRCIGQNKRKRTSSKNY